MIDLHSHILPGLDDGAQTIEESVALARAYVEAHVRTVAATPHVRADNQTTPETMEETLAHLQRELLERSIPLDVLGGGEVALDYLEIHTHADLRRFGLAGNPSYLLLEFPYLGWPLGLEAQVVELTTQGVTPVLAHPERNAEVQAAPERLGDAVAAGALVQITAASLIGRFGRVTRKAASRLVLLGLAHMVASDAHQGGRRLASLGEVRRAAGDPAIARWLLGDVPAAIVLGQAIPARPETDPPGPRLRRLVPRSLWTRGD